MPTKIKSTDELDAVIETLVTRAEVAEALREAGRRYERGLTTQAAFNAAADRLSPPAPKVELPTMEDWILRADWPGSKDQTHDHFQNLARLIRDGKARIELIP